MVGWLDGFGWDGWVDAVGPTADSRPPTIGEVWTLYEADKDALGVAAADRFDWRALEPEFEANSEPATFAQPTPLTRLTQGTAAIRARRAHSPNKIRRTSSRAHSPNKIRSTAPEPGQLASVEAACPPAPDPASAEAACPPAVAQQLLAVKEEEKEDEEEVVAGVAEVAEVAVVDDHPFLKLEGKKMWWWSVGQEGGYVEHTILQTEVMNRLAGHSPSPQPGAKSPTHQPTNPHHHTDPMGYARPTCP